MKTFALIAMVWGISASHLPLEIARIDRNDITGCASSELLREQMIDLVNRVRSEPRACGEMIFSGAPPLIWSVDLERAARHHSVQMATFNFFDHRGPDSTHVGNRVDAVGYHWRIVGENLFAGVEVASEVVYGWLDSPGHCKNLMNPDFTELGVACVRNTSSQYETYWTQVFAAPME
jgi:uncharacterized protein YkwD